ncbi:alpha/beta hydrolase [Cyanobacterium stanieri LEGE 03274]|uniref:Alpha/beta hydrolase n=1 Tax=Cyanobacterium stanieri LEGE 03274 TaxID=1828756 RepID=A0ABR9V2A5_9CHRO|nr:alpha/beta hydrolase [Cyanobacterium stanieri]MBE9222029.1 alpha/beta hydrolase [Cyanobacterium stanieri LEGE 03274]
MTTRKTFITNRNIEISYLEWHQGKTPLLLLHGMADHSLVWQNLGEYLQSKYHIVAPDLRGHGNSSKPTTGYFTHHIINDLEALLHHLQWNKIHILAHSWSAKLVPIWAKQNPQLFQTMTLVDPFYINKIPPWSKITFPFLYKVLPFLKMTGTFPDYQSAKNTAQSLKQYQGWSELQQKVFEYSIIENENQQWSSKFASHAKDEIFTDVMLQAGLTETITIPTLFIKPEKGLNKSSWQIKPFQKYLPNLTIKTVPGNHWAFLVEPESFNQVIEEFLEQN